MAGLKETFSKGLTTLNVKTNNFMEQNKINTYISTLEKEIYNLKLQVGERIYMDWQNGGVNIANIEPQLKMIADKYQEIQAQNQKIDQIQMEERQILGDGYNNGYCGGYNNGGYNNGGYNNGYNPANNGGNYNSNGYNPIGNNGNAYNGAANSNSGNNMGNMPVLCCSQCGTQNDPAYKFCVKCGNPLK